MTTLREAAAMALRSMEEAVTYAKFARAENYINPDAIKSLREALAQREPEPVAWMIYTLDGASVCVTDSPSDFTSEYRALPIYATPPQRKPLTDEEIDQLSRTMVKGGKSVNWLCQAIERAHGIGGEE